MANGGYGKRRAAPERKKPAVQRRPKALTVDKKSKPSKPKAVSLKNQMRSIERMLRKDLPSEVKEAQEKKLEGLKKQQEIQNRLALERKIFLRNRKIKFFERRKIDRRIRRLEKQQQVSTGQVQEAEIAGQLLKLKEDLEYVRFFPKVEKYVPLFIGGDDTEIVEKRNNLRKQIKANLIAAAASGKALEETGSDDDGVLDPSDDDFFVKGSSSDEADADEWTTDKSAREQASSTSGKAASGMSGDDKNLKQISARALMPPPHPSAKSFPNSMRNKSKFPVTSLGKKPAHNNRGEISTLGNTSSNLFMKRGQMDSTANNTRGEIFTSRNTSSSLFWKGGSTTGNSGNQSSNSDARKPKRKRRPKKKKQQES